MSSEMFETYEYDFNSVISSVNKKINSQIPNYSGGKAPSIGNGKPHGKVF